MHLPMRTSSFLEDTYQNSLIFWRFLLQSDIHRSVSYAYHRKYLNILNVRKLV